MVVPAQSNNAEALAANGGQLPKPLPIAPSGQEVSRKFPISSDSIVRQMNGSRTTPRPSPGVSQSLEQAAVENLLSRGGNVSVVV